MKPRKPLLRKTPLRANPEKTREWKNRSKKTIPARAPKRRKQESEYSVDRPAFLAKYPVCPVTGERTTDIHHSAKRWGKWLNLKRYWIAVSRSGHDWIEKNSNEAEARGLTVRINETYEEHIKKLDDLDDPVFYQEWNGQTLQTSYATT